MDFRRKGRRLRQDDAIDLTSLIDVIFILLIFFLVTASFSDTTDTSMPVELPEGSSGGDIQAQEELTIYIQADGTVSLRLQDAVIAENVSPAELEAQLTSVIASRGPRPVFLRGDEAVRYGEVVRVLDACRAAGFKQVFNIVRGQAN